MNRFGVLTNLETLHDVFAETADWSPAWRCPPPASGEAKQFENPRLETV